MYGEKIPSADSASGTPEKAKKGMDKPVSHGGTMGHQGVITNSGKPRAKNVECFGERCAEAKGVT